MRFEIYFLWQRSNEDNIYLILFLFFSFLQFYIKATCPMSIKVNFSFIILIQVKWQKILLLWGALLLSQTLICQIYLDIGLSVSALLLFFFVQSTRLMEEASPTEHCIQQLFQHVLLTKVNQMMDFCWTWTATFWSKFGRSPCWTWWFSILIRLA